MIDIVVKDCSCPICGAAEVANPGAPLEDMRINVRGFKVFHHGLWWSECLKCKETDGNGWFATKEDGTVVVEQERVGNMKARGIAIRWMPS